MIRTDDLVKSFGSVRALDGLSLHVEKGAVYGLTGVNGSGKTTLIKHLTGVMLPDSGICTIDGMPVVDNIIVKERMAYVPDELYFFGNYTLLGMRRFYKGLYPAWSDERYRQMVSDFGLPENSRINRFSKGMQKQAQFLLSLCTRPDVMILDEPIDGLDPIMRRKVWGWRLKDVADRQMTVLVSSHNLRELEGICDSVGIIDKGKLLFEGKLDDLKGQAAGLSLEELFFYEMGGEQA